MRFNKLDLNLLVALDVLLAEASISRAATRLNLSPSATSNALSRLREYFDDDLLVQVGRKMELTPRADALRESVRDVLVRIDSAVASPPKFDPSTSDRIFRIFASDYTQSVLAPHLLALAGKQHCTARFDFVPQALNPQRELDRGEADVVIIPRGFQSPDHPEETLYEEHFVCVLWRGAQLARGEFDFDRYLAASHIEMRPSNADQLSFEGWFVKRYGVTRRVAVTTYSFNAMMPMLIGTELVATVHARLAAQWAAALPIEIRPPPVQIAPMQQLVQWHQFRSQDPGLVWLREALSLAVQRMDAAPASG